MKTQAATIEGGNLRAPRAGFGAVALVAALGIVYGDIGTSPLYAFKAALVAVGIQWGPEDVLGVLSFIFWSVTLIVSVKYVLFVLRADNHGEGGILALLALIDPWGRGGGKKRPLLAAAGLFGCTLLIGDGTITPAVSVLSAIEGLKTIVPTLQTDLVLALTSVILAALFWVQRKGTGKIGKVFGPVMMVFFAVIGALGALGIARYPAVLCAILPTHAVTLVHVHGLIALGVFGAVFLCLTGGEAMYADLGHCGRGPITRAWFAVVCPAVLLNYFGQGASVILDPAALSDPFFNLVPAAGRLPMVVLSTAATVIASQALISGLFSLARQAMQLDLSPRFKVVQTERKEIGQIYVPGVNWALMVGCLALVWGFRSSDAMASAYGVAVAMTMLTTTALLCTLMRTHWGWNMARFVAFGMVFLTIDMTFTVSNLMKVVDGGWVPLLIALVCYAFMSTYARGSECLRRGLDARAITMDQMHDRLACKSVTRVPGAVQVFLMKTTAGLPPLLCEYSSKTRSVAETVIVAHFEIARVPFLHRKGNITAECVGDGFWRVNARYGYMQMPNVAAALEEARLLGAPVPHDVGEVTLVIGHETIGRAKCRSCLNRVQHSLFVLMVRNSARASQFFKLPTDRILVVGIHVDI
jgi:KUP system potassium uptake protein